MRIHQNVLRWLCSFFLVAVLLGMPAVADVAAQAVRSPELSVQFHRAETAWRTGSSVEEAKTRIDYVLRQAPDDADARKLRAQILLDMNRPMEALRDAQHAVFLRPEDAKVHLLVCEAARLSGDTARALNALERSAKYIGESADLHLRLSWNAKKLDQLEYAEALGRVALTLDDANPVAYYHLARVFVVKDQPDHAARVLRRGFEANAVTKTAIQGDDLLSSIAGHEEVAQYFKP